jgi:hypothetical protein
MTSLETLVTRVTAGVLRYNRVVVTPVLLCSVVVLAAQRYLQYDTVVRT